MMVLREFTEAELRRNNGDGDSPVLVAYAGKVYDLSESFLWRDGIHQALHWAGMDLTDELPDAPHGPEMLAKFPVVGILSNK